MAISLIKGFFSGALASVIYYYLGRYVVEVIPLPSPFPEAIAIGVLVALMVWLFERFLRFY